MCTYSRCLVIFHCCLFSVDLGNFTVSHHHSEKFRVFQCLRAFPPLSFNTNSAPVVLKVEFGDPEGSLKGFQRSPAKKGNHLFSL